MIGLHISLIKSSTVAIVRAMDNVKPCSRVAGGSRSSECVFRIRQKKIGGPYVSDKAGLNRGPLIRNILNVTLYTLFVRIE